MYSKVIVAVDLSEETNKVLARAIELVGSQTDKLVLMHVVEPVPAVWGMEAYTVDPINLQQQILDNAVNRLGEIGSAHGIDNANVHAVLGSPAPEIRNLAKSQSADAIVIGSHGNSGWKLMLGSTANKLLHGATCDVLTVHVGD
ncbi:MAG: universal stress protein [Gammaproteobacteria bacterium]|nr:universal stress protein [Gammaproteobacteria bacterium]